MEALRRIGERLGRCAVKSKQRAVDFDAVPRRLDIETFEQIKLRRQLKARGANDAVFQGVLCLLDTPSDRPPEGASMHRTLVPTELARRTMGELVGKPVNVDSALSGHAKKQIVGILTKSWIDGNKLMVQGRLFDKNQEALVQRIQANKGQLGMSFEIGNAAVDNEQAPVWTLTDLQWTGCALLDRSKAAYQSTAVSMAARAAFR